MALTDKQEMFCHEYLIDLNLNAIQAAIRVGYSDKTANAQASRLLMNVNIQNRIKELKSNRNERIEIDADYVLRRLVDIDQMDFLGILTGAGDLKPVKDWPKVWRTTLSGLDIMAMSSGEEGSDASRL